MFKKPKMDSIGFGTAKVMTLGANLVFGGLAMATVGMLILTNKTNWYKAANSKTIETINELHEHITD